MTKTARVLDVGNCDPDHGAIRWMIERNFDAQVDRATVESEAEAALAETAYDLVLVNRLLFANGHEGLKVIRVLKCNERTAKVPVMIISNFREAQEAAVAAGAVQGFGKSEIGSRETIENLANYLPVRVEA